MKIICFWVKKMTPPIRGFFKDGFMNDFSIRYIFISGTITLFGLHYLFGPFSALEQLLLIFCFFFMLAMEFVNSAIEDALDTVHPEIHEGIRKSKDLAAGASLCAGLFSLVCLAYVLSGNL